MTENFHRNFSRLFLSLTSLFFSSVDLAAIQKVYDGKFVCIKNVSVSYAFPFCVFFFRRRLLPLCRRRLSRYFENLIVSCLHDPVVYDHVVFVINSTKMISCSKSSCLNMRKIKQERCCEDATRRDETCSSVCTFHDTRMTKRGATEVMQIRKSINNLEGIRIRNELRERLPGSSLGGFCDIIRRRRAWWRWWSAMDILRTFLLSSHVEMRCQMEISLWFLRRWTCAAHSEWKSHKNFQRWRWRVERKSEWNAIKWGFLFSWNFKLSNLPWYFVRVNGSVQRLHFLRSSLHSSDNNANSHTVHMHEQECESSRKSLSCSYLTRGMSAFQQYRHWWFHSFSLSFLLNFIWTHSGWSLRRTGLKRDINLTALKWFSSVCECFWIVVFTFKTYITLVSCRIVCLRSPRALWKFPLKWANIYIVGEKVSEWRSEKAVKCVCVHTHAAIMHLRVHSSRFNEPNS